MLDLTKFTTEQRNQRSMDLDTMTSLQIVTTMNDEDLRAVQSVTKVLPQVAMAIDWAAETLERGGRVFYMGAGTSGRLGVLDASECPPTFGVSPDLIVGLIAGGETAFIKAVEGAEDSEELGASDLRERGLSDKDLVVGLAASGRTPYVVGGLAYAKATGCKTIAIACNQGSKIGESADLAIEPVPGPEVLTGSTRLKAGTVQKLILNMISTGAMVKIGKVYQNLMVDVQQTNEKLVVRGQNIVMEATGCTRERAVQALADAGGHVKTAIVSVLLDCDAEQAAVALEDVARVNLRLAALGFEIMAFVPGDANVRGPVFEGLPTVEAQRGRASKVALNMLELAHGADCDIVLVGDPDLSDAGWAQFAQVSAGYVDLQCELELSYAYVRGQIHHDRPDSSVLIFRSQESRTKLKPDSVPTDAGAGLPRKAGSIAVSNSGYGRYEGELEIARVDLPGDERMNVAGHITPEAMELLPFIKRGFGVRFV